MSVNSYAMDALTRHQVYLQRFGGGQYKKLLPLLENMQRDVNVRLLSEDLTAFQLGRLTSLQLDLSLIITSAMGEMSFSLVDELEGFSEYEAGFTNRLLDTMTTTTLASVPVEQLKASVTEKPMKLVSGDVVTTLTIPQAVTALAGTTSTTLNRTVQAGIARGDTTKVIADEVGRIIKHRTRSQIEALVRTSANHVGTVSRNAVYAENSEVIEMERFVATLDSRTSLTCSANDGKEFPIGQGAMPALHFNCRSVRIPVISPEYAVPGLDGERPSIGADGVEVVNARTNYQGWLRRQPASFQNEALGESRAKLFREGGLSIDRFTDDRNITYTLDELRALEPQAFERANL